MNVFALIVHFGPFKPVTAAFFVCTLTNVTSPVVPALSCFYLVIPSEVVASLHHASQNTLHTAFTGGCILRSITRSIESIGDINPSGTGNRMRCYCLCRMNTMFPSFLHLRVHNYVSPPP